MCSLYNLPPPGPPPSCPLPPIPQCPKVAPQVDEDVSFDWDDSFLYPSGSAYEGITDNYTPFDLARYCHTASEYELSNCIQEGESFFSSESAYGGLATDDSCDSIEQFIALYEVDFAGAPVVVVASAAVVDSEAAITVAPVKKTIKSTKMFKSFSRLASKITRQKKAGVAVN